MTKYSGSLDRMRIASPCSVGWERMAGDDHVRFCHECNLNVYNISGMTRKQAESLIASAQGKRLCVRLYRRADGTIITQDCPVGLRALRRRVSRVAGATFAALMSLCISALGQDRGKVCTQDAGKLPVKIEKSQADAHEGSAAISGVVTDPTGAAVPGAKITLTSKGSEKEQWLVSNDDGEFQFLSLAAGFYSVRIEMNGFKAAQIDHVEAKPNEVNRVTASLEVGDKYVEVGGAEVWFPDLSTTSVTTTITDYEFKHLPVPE